MISIPALVLTAGWVVLIAVILVLFGRTPGGAWSIAGSVARGVRDWAANRSERPPSPSPTRAPISPTAADATNPIPSAELDDFGDRPLRG